MNVLSFNKKVCESIIPTPIHKLKNISKETGFNVYCKRDDLTGFVFGGNKTRKLDFLIYDAIVKGYDCLLTVGGFQSNFCRLTSAYGAKYGLDVYLVLGGKNRPQKFTANLLMDKYFGAKITFVELENWDRWLARALQLRDSLIRKGKKPYFMPIGGSNVIGVQGYIEAFKEINEYNQVHFDYIFHATASGGTQSGLIAGRILFEYKTKVIGIAVAKSSEQLRSEIDTLLSEFFKNKFVLIKNSDIVVDDRFIGKGYAIPTKESQMVIKKFALTEGLILDSVYTGKAATGMLKWLKEKRISKGVNILFIHTGGNVEFFK
ncbi:MAG: 1-aminocyclopropane-1-carboxylate deaminase/D-cysteine desulfhydrase [Ignavibacteria bacterium]